MDKLNYQSSSENILIVSVLKKLESLSKHINDNNKRV